MTKTASTVAFWAVLFTAFMIATSTVASAATLSNPVFQNGDTAIQAQTGSTVTMKVQATIGANEVIEAYVIDTIGDNLPPALPVFVGGSTGLQEGTHELNVQVTVPPNTGTYSVNVTTCGRYGPTSVLNCSSDVVANQTFNNVVRAVGSSSVGSSVPTMSELMAMIASLTAQIAELNKPKPATKPAFCAQASAHTASYGQFGPAVTSYQHFLISSGFSIPAGATGYFGTQTASAASALAAACR